MAAVDPNVLAASAQHDDTHGLNEDARHAEPNAGEQTAVRRSSTLRGTIRLECDGRFVVVVRDNHGSATEALLEALVNSDLLNSRLEVSEAQASALRELRIELSQRRHALLVSLLKRSEVNPRTVGQMWEREQQEVRVRFDDILLPHQLDELVCESKRKNLKILGWLGAIQELESSESLALTAEQRAHFRSVIEKRRQDAALERKVSLISAYQDFFGILSPVQRARLDSLVDWNETNHFSPLELAIAQLREATDLRIDRDPFAGLRGTYSISSDGNLRRTRSMTDEATAVIYAVCNDPRSGILDSQFESIWRQRDEPLSELSALTGGLNSGLAALRAKAANGQLTIEELNERAAALFVNYDREMWREFLKVLLPHQADAAYRVLLNLEIKHGGILASMTCGHLHQELELSGEQSKALSDATEKALDRLDKLARNLDNESRSEILPILTAEQKRWLETEFGPLDDEPFGQPLPELMLSERQFLLRALQRKTLKTDLN